MKWQLFNKTVLHSYLLTHLVVFIGGPGIIPYDVKSACKKPDLEKKNYLNFNLKRPGYERIFNTNISTKMMINYI